MRARVLCHNSANAFRDKLALLAVRIGIWRAAG
jgi:hypothetical protein